MFAFITVMVLFFMYGDDKASASDHTALYASIACAILLICATFFGRVYYGVHSFPDVVGGLVLALTITWFYLKYAL